MSSVIQFIENLKSQSKESVFSIYSKQDMITFLKQLGIDATIRNTKDELYKKLIMYFNESETNTPPSKGG